MRGDAEVKDLVEAGSEKVAGFRIEFAPAQPADEAVEPAHMAEDAIEELGEQPAVRGGEGVFFEKAVEDFV